MTKYAQFTITAAVIAVVIGLAFAADGTQALSSLTASIKAQYGFVGAK